VASDVAGSPHATSPAGGAARSLSRGARLAPPAVEPARTTPSPRARRGVPVCARGVPVCARCVPSARRAGGSLCDVTGVRAAGFRVTAAHRACEARGARAVQEQPVSPVFLRAVRVWQHTAVRRPPATPTRPSAARGGASPTCCARPSATRGGASRHAAVRGSTKRTALCVPAGDALPLRAAPRRVATRCTAATAPHTSLRFVALVD